MEERRNKMRVSLRTEVVLKFGDREIAAKSHSKDISLNGIFVYTDQKLPVGSFCNLGIMLSGSSSELSLKMIGKIAREGEDGLGIAFESVDVDSYFHLKNIVKYNIINFEVFQNFVQRVVFPSATMNRAN